MSIAAQPVTRLELLLSYLGGIEAYLADPTVTEIMLIPDQGDYVVYIEKAGRMEEVRPSAPIRQGHLKALANDIARNQLHREINDEDPALSATLPDGSRIAIVVPPAAEGMVVTIRKFRDRAFSLMELIDSGCLPRLVAEEARAGIERRENFLISGANGTGKTTILNALASECIPTERRIVIIEDEVREIRLPRHRNKVHFRAGGYASIGRLLRESLRHRIEHVIIGEVLGAEGFDLVDALNTGHGGSFATIHGNSAVLALSRLTKCVMKAGHQDYTPELIRSDIAEAIQYVLHLEKSSDQRRLKEFVRVAGYDETRQAFRIERLA